MPSALAKSDERVVGDLHADAPDAGEFARVRAKLGRAGALQRAQHFDARRLVDGAHQRAPHPAGGAGDDQTHVSHRIAFEKAISRAAL